MANEIKIDESIQKYAEEFVPEIIRINRYLQQLTNLYETEFSFYRGEARKEIDTYKDELIKQVTDLSNNYSVLANNLITIVLEFLAMDSEAEAKINAFAQTINERSLESR